MKSSFNQNMSFRVPKARKKGKTLPRECHLVARECVVWKDPQALKRTSPYSSSVFDTYTGKTQNVVAVKAGKRQRVHPAIISQGEVLNRRDTHVSFKERLSGYNDLERANVRNFVTECTLAESLKQYDTDDACSVGSCSVNDKRENKFSNCSMKLPCLETNFLFSEAESFCCSAHLKENCSCCFEEKVEVSVHSLELRAYCCTLQALYVSGPLSWEQEELLTNLRIMLHISNDEHLTELRNLIPSRSSK